jgi:predicted butyrate kinase (DUF1464 family)
MSLGNEWDWPPKRRQPPRRYQTIDAVPKPSGWESPIVTRAGYSKIVITTLKMALGAVLGLVIVGCLWLIVTILCLP